MGTVTVAEDAISGQGHAFRDPAGNVVHASGNPCFVVPAMPGPDGCVDVDRVGAAVAAAAVRFERVTYSGDELTAPDDDHYTPHLVLGPVVADDGLLLWADTWSELPTPCSPRWSGSLSRSSSVQAPTPTSGPDRSRPPSRRWRC